MRNDTSQKTSTCEVVWAFLNRIPLQTSILILVSHVCCTMTCIPDAWKKPRETERSILSSFKRDPKRLAKSQLTGRKFLIVDWHLPIRPLFPARKGDWSEWNVMIEAYWPNNTTIYTCQVAREKRAFEWSSILHHECRCINHKHVIFPCHVWVGGGNTATMLQSLKYFRWL